MDSIDHKKHAEERQAFAFEKMVQDFIEVYAPDNSYAQAQFSARLMGIVRQSFIDGGQRADNHLKEVIGCLPPARPKGMGPL
jgi:hypothetical protein